MFVRLAKAYVSTIAYGELTANRTKGEGNVIELALPEPMRLFFKEFFRFARQEKKWWLIPLIVVVLLVVAIVILTASSGIAWGIYK